MDLTHATIVVLASMMFVLSAMVGYLYWQHTRLNQSIQSLAVVVSTIVNTVPSAQAPQEEEEEPEPKPEPKPEPEEAEPKPEAEEDDRVSVVDVDDLQSKTAAQLRELLDKKGIPYGKRDSKTTLIELLKATA
jgi:outer membrane biosynthesis protein TonB